MTYYINTIEAHKGKTSAQRENFIFNAERENMKTGLIRIENALENAEREERKGNNHPTLIMDTKEDTGTFRNENGELRLKDSASKILLTVAYKRQLENRPNEAENIFNTVSAHCSDTFDLDNELESAQKNAVESLIKKL